MPRRWGWDGGGSEVRSVVDMEASCRVGPPAGNAARRRAREAGVASSGSGARHTTCTSFPATIPPFPARPERTHMRKAALIIGILLILAGGFSLVGGAVSWTQEETIVDVGPLEATAETRESAALPPIAAGALLLVGVGATVWGAVGKS